MKARSRPWFRKTALSRKDRTRRLIVIGAVIAAKAEKEEEFRACLMQWLDEGVTAERDRLLFDLAHREDPACWEHPNA